MCGSANPRRAHLVRLSCAVLALSIIAVACAQGSRTIAPATATSMGPAVGLPPSHPWQLPDDDRSIVHVLNRLGYGPRPGDIALVRHMGLARYIERQLYPDQIPEPLLDQKLHLLPTLAMDAPTMAAKYPPPTPEEIAARQKALGQRPPSDQSVQGQTMARSAPMMGPSGGIRPAPNRPQQILTELASAKLLRAVYGERQLAEILTDFWFNHFNVFAQKGADRWLVTSYERDAIRPHILGRFRDLLEATARHPAMLFYLDNWLSSTPQAAGARPGAARTGLNENYARELLELHTLGVDGGYTQQDVTEVARCFTGWSIDRPRLGGGFIFRPRLHDQGEKIVLGVRIPAGGGQADGERVLDLLARHPATARHIAVQLVQRLVADTPPPGLVDKVAQVFLATDGDLRAVVRTIVTAPEFFAATAMRTKVKTPLELVASAARTLGADVQSVSTLPTWVARLGEPLYQALPPTGYPPTTDGWLTAGTLLDRLNFAGALAANRIPGVWVDVEPLSGPGATTDPKRLADDLASRLLHVTPVAGTAAALDEATRGSNDVPSILTAQASTALTVRLVTLILGSPDFQYH